MPSFMDQAMGDWKPPTSDDFEISLPPRREAKKDEPTDAAREQGQHGGGGDSAAADTHAETSTASEPAPQRDDPDEGEHTDSTQEQVAARRASPVEEPATPTEEPAAAPAEDDRADDEVEIPAVFAPEPPTPEPADLHEALAAIDGRTPREFKRIGFSSGDAKTVLVKKFPQPLVDRLRVLLAVGTGGDFAEQISAPAIIAAYLTAATGVELDVDENTAVAIEAFRANEPRMASVEDRLEQMAGGIDRLADAMQLGLKRISETGHTVDAMDFATSFLVADRVAGIATVDTNETNVDVADKKVLAARERIRSRAKEHRTIETQREGRRLA